MLGFLQYQVSAYYDSLGMMRSREYLFILPRVAFECSSH